MSDQQRNGGVSQQASGHAAEDHFSRPRMAIGADDNQILMMAFCKTENDVATGSPLDRTCSTTTLAP